MPVVRGAILPDTRPEWCNVTSAGIFGVSTADGRFDNHYHDCDEYWLVFTGKAKVKSEGEEFYVQCGDIVCTKTGDDHDVVEVYEDLQAFWFEDATPEGGRIGHLWRNDTDAAGHPVPCKPLPEDFPA